MLGALLAAVVLVAAGVWVARRLQARAARRHAASGPGSSPERAIAVRSFDEIDRTVAARRCVCGTPLQLTGEGAREAGGRRYRLARLTCDECEEETVVYFDVTAVLH